MLQPAGHPEDDVVLVRAAQAGGDAGREALAELYRRHYEPLVRLLACVDRELALADREDIAQAVFIEVWEGRLSHDGRGPLLSHLLRRARGRVANRYRAQQTRRDHERRQGRDGQAEGERDGLAELTRRERQAQVRIALAELAEGQRRAIELIDLKGMKATAAAALLDESVAAVKKRRQRGWERLREGLGVVSGVDLEFKSGD